MELLARISDTVWLAVQLATLRPHERAIIRHAVQARVQRLWRLDYLAPVLLLG